MFTRALVGIADGKRFDYTYLHSDGYPEWTGRILRQQHNNPTAAALLVAHGDISGLGVFAGVVDRCSDSEPSGNADLTELHDCARQMWAEWIYLWRDGAWHAAADQNNAERRIDYTATDGLYTPLRLLPDAPLPPEATPREMFHPQFQ